MARAKRIGIVDLAAHLGLSSYTVSRALNGHSDVGAVTRERVLAAAQELGYTPNWLGQKMRSKQTDLVVFMLTASPNNFIDNYFLPVLTGVDAVLTPEGYSVIVTRASPGKQEQDMLRRFVEGGGCDALVLTRMRASDPRVPYLQEQAFPFVTLGRDCDAPDNVFVDVDHRSGSKEATKWLIANGHRRIAIINTPLPVHSSQQRLEGWKEALVEAGIQVEVGWESEGDYSAESGLRITRQLLGSENPPTAIICGTDDMAFGAFGAVRELGLIVGKDVSIIGCDDIPMASLLDPPLTTFRTSLKAFGETLAHQVLALLRGQQPESLLIKPEFVLRGSAGPVAVRE